MKKPLLIVTATELEMKYILGCKSNFKQGILFGEKDIFYLVTGIGVINSAIFLTKAILNQKFNGIINLGIAGSFDRKKFPVKSVAIVKEEIWGEFGIKENKILSCKKLGFPLGILGKEKVWNKLKLHPEKVIESMKLRDIIRDIKYKRAKSLTVSTVTGDSADADKLKKWFEVDIENMEGFSLAWVCKIMNIPFLEIRTISNLTGSERKNTWDLKGALKVLKEVSTQILNHA